MSIIRYQRNNSEPWKNLFWFILKGNVMAKMNIEKKANNVMASTRIPVRNEIRISDELKLLKSF